MSDRPSLLALDAPTIDKDRLRARTGVTKPTETPSLWSQFTTAAQGAAANDDPAADAARQQNVVDDALAPIVADLEKRGINAGAYTARNARDGFAVSYDQDAIWQGIARARALDPKSFAGVEQTPDAFRKRITAPIQARIAGERDTQKNSSWVPWLAGQFVGGASDPINQAAMLAGMGPARSIAQAALRDAAVNVQTELIQEPVRAIALAKQGKVQTPGQVVQDLGLAAGTGAFFGAVTHGIGEAVTSRVKTPSGVLADDMRAKIGPDRMTDDERAATALLDKVDEVSAISPFTPGAGTDAHLARMDRATATLEAGPTAAPIAPEPPPVRFDLNDYSTRVGIHESGGKWDRQAKSSSAYGMYQITRPTFLRYAKRETALAAMPDDVIWGRRTNPAMQEKIFKAITADNRAALAKIGAPETYGNMYLMHFAGEGGGRKILRAEPSTPIAEILKPEAITANPFLRGKTAGEVIEWAHQAVNDKVHAGPVLRRDQFDADDAWASAQRDVDAIDAEARATSRAEAAQDTVWGEVDDIPGFDEPAIAPDARPVGSDWDPGEPRAITDPETVSNGAAAADAVADTSPALAQKAEPVRPTLSQSEAIDLETRGLGPASMLSFVEKKGAPGISFLNEDGNWATAIYRTEDGVAQGIVRMSISDEARDIGNEVSSYVVPALRRKGVASRLYDSIRENGFDIDELSGAADLTPDGAAFVNARRAATVENARAASDVLAAEAPDRLDAIEASGFDSPDDVAAARQIDSLEHDLRMVLDEKGGADFQVRLDDEGRPVTARQALDDLDADDAAIAAARACMVPAGGPDAEVPF